MNISQFSQLNELYITDYTIQYFVWILYLLISTVCLLHIWRWK